MVPPSGAFTWRYPKPISQDGKDAQRERARADRVRCALVPPHLRQWLAWGRASEEAALPGLQVQLRPQTRFAKRTTITNKLSCFCCRLGKRIFAQPLLLDRNGKAEAGKLKQIHRPASKVTSEDEAGWRFVIPSTIHKDAVRDLYKAHLPRLRTLLRAVEVHPGFDWEAKPGDTPPLTSDLSLFPSERVLPFLWLPASLHNRLCMVLK